MSPDADGIDRPHLDHLPPKVRDAIRECAARVAADAPPLSPDQITFLREMFGPAAQASRRDVA